MNSVVAAYLLASAAMVPQAEIVPNLPPVQENWCTVGYKVMIPDGREGRVTSVSGEICRVLADGEAYVSLMPHFIVEPVYPQDLAKVNFGH